MPLPSPSKNEDRKTFINRCMGDNVMKKEYPDTSQRRAVCESQWDNRDKKANSNDFEHVIQYLGDASWAILPDTLDTINRVVAARLHNGKQPLSEEIEIQLRGDEQDRGISTTKEGVRIIPVHGVISKRMNLFTRISGGTSTELLEQDVKQALSDKSVKAIMLDVESPGGSVDGPFELSDFIYNARGQKPLCAYANGLMTSAAYLIASATDKIVGSQVAQVGSIGVIIAHYDYSQYDEKVGVKRTYLTAGKYKAMGHDAAPLSKEGEEYIQEKLDYLYTMFVDSVARNRGMSTEKVLAEMADGKVFIGEQAKNVGLIDSIGTFQDSLNHVFTKESLGKQLMFNYPKNKEVKFMNLEEFKAEHPEAYSALSSELTTQITGTVSKDFEAKLAAKSADTEGLLGKRISDLEANLANRDEEVDKLKKNEQKREALQLETNRKAEADKIFAAKLSASKIPENMHEKVRPMVSHSKFVKDDVFDAEAFTTAVDAEVADWETKLADSRPSSEVLGSGFVTKSLAGSEGDATQDNEDSNLADSLFSLCSFAPGEGGDGATQH